MIRKISAILAVVLISGSVAFAASVNQQATFTVAVSSVFELGIDYGLVDFGKMKPGDTKWNMPSSGITITAKTNNGKPWYLKVSNDSPFTSGSDVIQNSNFMWSGWSDGSGVWYGTGNDKIATTPTLVYASGSGEDNNLPDGTNNHMKFKLAVPKNQRPGSYITTVKFTMTE